MTKLAVAALLGGEGEWQFKEEGGAGVVNIMHLIILKPALSLENPIALKALISLKSTSSSSRVMEHPCTEGPQDLPSLL